MTPLLMAAGEVAFRAPWSRPALLAVALVVVLVPLFLYRSERTLSLPLRFACGGLRAALLLLLCLLLMEPVLAESRRTTVPGNVLVLVDVSESMGFADDRKRPGEVADAAIALGKLDFRATSLPDAFAAAVRRTPRLDLARGILTHPDLAFFRDPGPKHRLRWFAFGDRLEPGPDAPEQVRDWLAKLEPAAPTTALGDALSQAVERFAGQPIAGVVVLTDGASNDGADPLETARGLRLPVVTIGLGVPRAEDVRLVAATHPETVFPKDRVPVRVQVSATPGFAGREVALALHGDGEELERKAIRLAGGTQFEELAFTPEQASGSIKLEIVVSPLDDEATAENNRLTRSVKIIDEKIRVLFVEGRPRWEFRYLRAVLERDHRMAVKFLMTEGDPDLAQASDRYVARFPEDEAAAFRYDLVILGDVPATHFTPAQLTWLEKLVREKGGSFLMLAGQRFAPATYASGPVAKLLPVQVSAGRQVAPPTLHPVATPAGKLSQILALESSDEENRAAWELVRPLVDLPRLDGAKPGATVLATLSDQAERDDPYPLVAWQRYGSGKAMYVGSDKLWRLRFKRGDTYHAAFWSQAIQFLTLSRLLGENKRVRLETERKTYRAGERVLVQATLLDGDYKPVRAEAYNVLVEAVPPRGEPRALTLRPVPAQEGLYQGFLTADVAGRFQVKPLPADEPLANRAEYVVEAVGREKVEPDLQAGALARLAKLSGGKALSMRELPTLAEQFADRSREVTLPPAERELWDNWWVFLLVLALAGAEWLLRRANDIA